MAVRYIYTGATAVGRSAYRGLSRKGFTLNWFVVVAVAIYFYFRGRSGGSPFNDYSKNPETPYDATNVTISQQKAEIYARQLLSAMDGVGTDEPTIENIIDNLKTADDYKLVHVEFGSKPYNGFGLPSDTIFSDPEDFPKKNLVEWLHSEISLIHNPILFNKIKRLVNAAGFVFSN
ncbi:hypothetical protein [Aegicerativicinus sediminis]|uniref:hypothetical protein n=1 Tax=Aegicerativicinus sediminis TaxID=2893202 RepID=UPI001E4B444D|nr:hypothetical protein [Aegicerativicinus sediminis]